MENYTIQKTDNCSDIVRAVEIKEDITYLVVCYSKKRVKEVNSSVCLPNLYGITKKDYKKYIALINKIPNLHIIFDVF